MKRKPFIAIFSSLLVMTLLFGGYSCSSDDDYLTEQEVRLIIREELRNFLTEEQIVQLINSSVSSAISEDRLRQIIIEELKNSITPEQIQQIIDEMAGGLLTEEEIRRIIQEETEKVTTQWEVINFSVKKADWGWNENTEQYEVIFDFPELTEAVYEKGAAIGYIFIGTQGVDEVQKLLPYVFTYKEKLTNGETVTYTETVSCDFEYKPSSKSTVGFFIQASDRVRADENLPANYNFRIVLIW